MSISLKDYNHTEAIGLNETIECLEKLLIVLKTKQVVHCESVGTVVYTQKEYKFSENVSMFCPNETEPKKLEVVIKAEWI